MAAGRLTPTQVSPAMTQITLTKAQLHLSELIAKLQPGEAVQICQDDVMASIGFTFTMK